MVLAQVRVMELKAVADVFGNDLLAVFQVLKYSNF